MESDCPCSKKQDPISVWSQHTLCNRGDIGLKERDLITVVDQFSGSKLHGMR
jgi:hypothetical protein